MLEVEQNSICHPSHDTVHPPTPPWLPIGHNHGHEWSIHIPFRSVSISPPIPQLRLFQTLTFKLQGQGHGCGQRSKTKQSAQYLICFLFVLHQSDNNSWDAAILKFDPEKSTVKVMGEVKVWGHILHPVSNQCTCFSFYINRTNHSWDMSNRVFDLEKNRSEILKENLAKKGFNKIAPKSNQVISMTL